jgi:hypothetical protein
MSSEDNYQAYLLRLWRDDGQTPWRASLQEAQAGQLISFASVAQLVAFLEQQTQESHESTAIKKENE